jgi:predicted alpha/beta-hydrolase family hydrolase
LESVKVPMLFLSGTRDALAEVDLLKSVMKALGTRATLSLFKDADHSFHVPKASGKTDAEVLAEVLDAAAEWMERQ